MIKAQALYKEISGCDYHRICLPFEYEHGYVDDAAMEAAGPTVHDRLKVAELVVWNRDFPAGIAEGDRLKRQHGFKVVVDLDDYWELYPHHFLSAYYRQHDVPGVIIHNLRLADAVTVTTARLADKVKQYNRNVHVIPNALPFGQGQFQGAMAGTDIFRFIYAGQKSHLHDLGLLRGPLRRLAGERHAGMGVTLAGYSTKDTAGIWTSMEQIMSAGGTMSNYQRIEQRPLHSYMDVYNEASAVLIPLEANIFNACKSNLKLLEAACKKLPAICQRVPPYSDCRDAPVLWVDKQSDWYKHMRYLAANRGAAEEMGQALHEWAIKNYSIWPWNKIRFDLYTHIVNS
ncbi:glycosyltransferase family protein [Chitinophaga japonensis]|uniref:Glycosyltransferase involved in cell wall biosynthesis n=1 Tax=Chitinophaga japonensis TaxID=104662 RepID=A0A562SZ22_CHIJA|nr:glycosyltransferase family 4 protein [Chitinophaga japonensis]TWI86308.1 glycosyltransferase involved in cell wall biosynthesis [Chitinophaga japonensis]